MKKWNREAICSGAANSLKLCSCRVAGRAASYSKSPRLWPIQLAPGEIPIVAKGWTQTNQGVKIKFKYGSVVFKVTFCCNISKVDNAKVTNCMSKEGIMCYIGN